MKYFESINNKAIIEFDFRRIWRILQIKEGVIHRGQRPRWITPSEVCRILHILGNPNSIIALLLFIQNISSFLRWLTTVLVVFPFPIYCLLSSFTILCEIWTIRRQQMAKMSDRVPSERLGTIRLSHVFLKIYSYDPTSKFQE